MDSFLIINEICPPGSWWNANPDSVSSSSFTSASIPYYCRRQSVNSQEHHCMLTQFRRRFLEKFSGTFPVFTGCRRLPPSPPPTERIATFTSNNLSSDYMNQFVWFNKTRLLVGWFTSRSPRRLDGSPDGRFFNHEDKYRLCKVQFCALPVPGSSILTGSRFGLLCVTLKFGHYEVLKVKHS